MNGIARTSTSSLMPATARPVLHGRSRSIDRDDRQFRWMVAIGFFLLLVPAAIARLSGWRWRPWPPGRSGYRSIVGEAKEAAETYITFAFLGW